MPQELQLNKFALWSKIFCLCLTALPAYFVFRGEIPTGRTSSIFTQKTVQWSQNPVEFGLLLFLVGTFVAAAWGLRHFLLKELRKIKS